MQILNLEQIKKVLPSLDMIHEIEQGFVAYSEGRVIVPPVGEMILGKGEVHIKYGFIKGDDHYVIKVASGFYQNHLLGLPSGNGLMLLFDQNTGALLCVLLDEGYLTDIRTAIAGAIAAKHLAPKKIVKIGMVGAGIQSRLQLLYLKNIIECKDVLVWGTGQEELDQYKKDMEKEGFHVDLTLDTSDIVKHCNLIVTATPSKIPLIKGEKFLKGTHITAVGSDTMEKQEVDASVLKKADIVVADSIEQCMKRGEIFQAIKASAIKKDKVIELGHIISGFVKGRTSDNQLSIADLTGVAVQDIKIASAVYRKCV
jgi:ornithine cyclodeaminase